MHLELLFVDLPSKSSFCDLTMKIYNNFTLIRSTQFFERFVLIMQWYTYIGYVKTKY